MHTTLTEFELSVGAVRPLLNTLFCMWAWQLNLFISFTCQAGMIGEFLENFGGGGLQRARRLGRKSLFSALNSSRALAALAPKFSTNSPTEPVSNLL